MIYTENEMKELKRAASQEALDLLTAELKALLKRYDAGLELEVGWDTYHERETCSMMVVLNAIYGEDGTVKREEVKKEWMG